MRVALCVTMLGGVLFGSVASASASDTSIKAVIKSYDSRILVSEGHVVSAIGEYKASGNPTRVQSALTESIGVLRSLKSKIASRSAGTPRVKEGKAKLEKGLHSVIVAYQRLKTAFGEKRVSPSAAKAEAKKAVSSIRQGRKELAEGIQLLR